MTLLFFAFMLACCYFHFLFSDRRSLKIEYENNNMQTLTTEVSSMELEFKVHIETSPGWLELPLVQTNFHGSSLFKSLTFYCISIKQTDCLD